MKYMEMAIEEAKKAYDCDEVPVGCVITDGKSVIASSHNTTESDKDITCHAEINAIKSALKSLGTKDLKNCDVYVTLEPCPMCAGALINAKVKRIYIGAMEPKSGCFGSKIDFNKLGFNHKPEIYYGISEDASSKLMTDFFEKKR